MALVDSPLPHEVWMWIDGRVTINAVALSKMSNTTSDASLLIRLPACIKTDVNAPFFHLEEAESSKCIR